MEVTEPHSSSLSRDQLQLQLRDVENRSGRSVDLRAVIRNAKKVTVSRHDIYSDPPGPLLLLLASETPPEGAELDYAGTAYISGEQKVVAIYR
jgi:hypothetical protein